MVDNDQSTSSAFMHAMRSPDQSISDAEQQWNQYIEDCTQEFISQSGDNSIIALGRAIHALTDRTSPPHSGFQLWSGMKGIFDMFPAFIHFRRELWKTDISEITDLVRKYYYRALARKQSIENNSHSVSENDYLNKDRKTNSGKLTRVIIKWEDGTIDVF